MLLFDLDDQHELDEQQHQHEVGDEILVFEILQQHIDDEDDEKIVTEHVDDLDDDELEEVGVVCDEQHHTEVIIDIIEVIDVFAPHLIDDDEVELDEHEDAEIVAQMLVNEKHLQ